MLNKLYPELSIAGLDIGGYTKLEKTVLSILKNEKIHIFSGLNDKDIVNLMKKNNVQIVSIDAPLSIPKKTFRNSDIKLKEILKNSPYSEFQNRVLPPLIPGMRVITKRGMKIARMCKKEKILPIETHPFACLYFLVLAENKKYISDLKKYKKGDCKAMKNIIKFLKGKLPFQMKTKIKSNDEIDSLISLLVSLYYIKKKTYFLSNFPFVIIYPFEKNALC